MTGPLPESIYRLKLIHHLLLNDNSFRGKIDFYFRSCKILRTRRFMHPFQHNVCDYFIV